MRPALFWACPAPPPCLPHLPLPLRVWAVPVLLWDVQRHHLQGLQALDCPAVALAYPLYLHLQEAVGHAAPEHRLDGLDVQPRRTLGDWVFLLTLKYGRRQRHCILGQGEKAFEKKTDVQIHTVQVVGSCTWPMIINMIIIN